MEDAAWKKYVPKLREIYKNAPKEDKGIWGDFFPDGIEDTEVHVVDSEGQDLNFRIGPVFGKAMYKEPGIWIQAQRRYMSSNINMCFLMSPEIWKRLSKMVEQELKSYSTKNYGPSKKKVISARTENKKKPSPE